MAALIDARGPARSEYEQCWASLNSSLFSRFLRLFAESESKLVQ